MITISYEEKTACNKLTSELKNTVPINRDIVILCIGTDRSTGDTLGPLVGYHLHKFKKFNVYGTLDEPVHAVNLETTLDQIKRHHHNPFIIAVDACLGPLKSVGNITVSTSPLKPGAGVGKDLPSVGDISVKGVVNVSGYMEMLVLQNTRLSTVMKMSKVISDALFLSMKDLTKTTV